MCGTVHWLQRIRVYVVRFLVVTAYCWRFGSSGMLLYVGQVVAVVCISKGRAVQVILRLGPMGTLQYEDTAVFETSGSTHPTTERHISGCSLFLCLHSTVTASRSCFLQHSKHCAETRTTQLASKFRSLYQTHTRRDLLARVTQTPSCHRCILSIIRALVALLCECKMLLAELL